MCNSQNQEQVAVRSAIDRDWSMFGVEGFVIPSDSTEEEQTVELNDITIGEHDDELRQILNNEFPVSFNDNNFGIDTFCDVKERVAELLH